MSQETRSCAPDSETQMRRNFYLLRFYFYFTQFGSHNLHAVLILNDERRKEDCYGNSIGPDFEEL